MHVLKLQTKHAQQAVDVTERVAAVVREWNLRQGAVLVFCPHTTAGITINEHADPAVMQDVNDALRRLVPPERHYRHREGNSHAHIQAILTGNSVTVPVEENGLCLGTWQGIFLMEYDGPRWRELFIQGLKSDWNESDMKNI
ncbi:MAG: secondary thiamine-phosphate synthase enzyme YjbQ [Bacillota bacterium]|nr:secondary thiamine-phosphate synthase enzyme YjbQ [Bacillota bacterium]MDW7683373.1 secondary thiamine-phosphate synthase enzyme YjbQ [Bacillota bacterium]